MLITPASLEIINKGEQLFSREENGEQIITKTLNGKTVIYAYPIARPTQIRIIYSGLAAA